MRSLASRPVALPRPLPRHGTAPQRAQLLCRSNYRWSAEEAGGPKRESLYDDNGEPSSMGGGWQTPAAAVNGRQQQADAEAAWEAAAAAESSSTLRQRRARGAAVGDRVSQRRLRRQQQQQQQPAPEPAPAAAAEAAAPGAAAEADDPWVAAELRQLRRRRRASGQGAAPLADPWAQEWGPLEGAPAAAAAASQDFGWAAESWARDSSETARTRRQEQRDQDEADAAAGPGSGWDLRQQQREQWRRRRAGDSEAGVDGTSSFAEQAAAWAAAQALSGSGAGAAAGGRPRRERQQQQQQQQEWLGGEDDEELEDYLEDNYGSSYSSSNGSSYSSSGGAFSQVYEEGVSAEPDIALLSSEELERVLPVVPFSQQAAFFSGTATDGVQRWGASLALTVLLSKVAVLAASSLTWPLWWPWALAARKNLAVRRQLRYGGLWRTSVLEVTVTGRPKPFSSASADGLLGGSTMRMAGVVVGDPGGAQTEMALPYDSRYELIQPGEPAELVVLSGDTSFLQFKAVKDVYLPNSGLWVSEYPHCDRTQLLEISLAVEREAEEAAGGYGPEAEEEEEAEEQQQWYGGGGGEQPYGGGGDNRGGWQQSGEWRY